MRVVTISSRIPTESYYCYHAFVASCQRFGVDPVILTEGYGGLGTKPVILRNYLINSNEKHIIFCDAWDVMFQRDPNEIPKVDKLVFNAEKALFPFDSRLAGAFPDPKTPYRYLNSGFSFGPTELYLEAINSMPQDYVVPDRRLENGSMFEPNDQPLWQQVYLYGNVKMALDTHAEYCHTLSNVEPNELDFNGPLIMDKELGTTPVALHLNGSKEKWKPLICSHLNLPM